MGDFTGYSIRMGAATWADVRGLTRAQVRLLGRWKSDCYRVYIDLGPSQMLAHSKKFQAMG